MKRYEIALMIEGLQKANSELKFKLRIEEERAKGLQKEIEILKEENATLWELTNDLLGKMRELIPPMAFAKEVGGYGN